MKLLPYSIAKTWSPEVYQGGVGQKRQGYFEGWYNKIVSAEGDVFAFIPGVSFRSDGTGEAFIQSINGNTTSTNYHSFKKSEFTFSKTRYDIQVGSSRFSQDGMAVDISDGDTTVTGEIRYKNRQPLSTTLFSPGIMGWYTFVPFMECYHGVVSLDHDLEGLIIVDGRPVNFDGGKGYIEKDWGRSFPSSWVWAQSNHFSGESTSCMLSIARIPWLGGSFPGFLCVILVNGMQYRFASYTGAKISRLIVGESEVEVEISDRRHSAKIQIAAGEPGGLKAPVNGSMARIITESLSSTLRLVLETSTGKLLYRGTGKYCGLEIAGDTREIAFD